VLRCHNVNLYLIVPQRNLHTLLHTSITHLASAFYKVCSFTENILNVMLVMYVQYVQKFDSFVTLIILMLTVGPQYCLVTCVWGVARAGKWYNCPGQQRSRGGKIAILNKETLIYCA